MKIYKKLNENNSKNLQIYKNIFWKIEQIDKWAVQIIKIYLIEPFPCFPVSSGTAVATRRATAAAATAAATTAAGEARNATTIDNVEFIPPKYRHWQ